MNKEKSQNNIEEKLFEYFENKKKLEEIPISTKNIINNAFRTKNRKHYKSNIPQMIIYVFSIIILSTGVVFAKEIVGLITSLFVNTTNSIDTAVENGYIQNINMDYVYDNDIGIKVDNILLDDTNLDISFVYNYKNKDVVSAIELYEYSIRDENNNLIYEVVYDENRENNENSEAMHLIKYNESVMIDYNEFKESLIFVSKELSDYKKIRFNIDSVRLKINDEYKICEGNWNFETNIDWQKLKRNTIFYDVESNKCLNNSFIEITETSLKINLEFKEDIDEKIIKEKDNIILIDSEENKYMYNILKLKDSSKLYLEYDISKYFENIDNMELVIKINSNKEEIIKLKKRHS